jgi:ABC-type antimicrobial peptide transport system permease subunit
MKRGLMRAPPLLQKSILIVLLLALIAGETHGLIAGQAPPSYKPAELDKLVSRIALYPALLLAQILAAATYPDQIPDAAKWADEHH